VDHDVSFALSLVLCPEDDPYPDPDTVPLTVQVNRDDSTRDADSAGCHGVDNRQDRPRPEAENLTRQCWKCVALIGVR
jgi:hypothetical protein